MSIDCHIHIFKKEHPAIASARHLPQYDALLSEVQSLGKPLGVEQFVLVQTSFMGTNNDYLVEQIQQCPSQLRGVFILAPDTSRATLRDLKSSGVVGIRLNLFGTDLNVSLDPAQLQLIENCSAEGLSIGIHDDAQRLVTILDRIQLRAQRLVIDHFGRPESLPLADQDPVYSALIEKMAAMNAYIKISAPYRAKNMDPARAYHFLEKTLGIDRLLWGSDWPWTQNENYLTYEQWAHPFGSVNLAKLLAPNAKYFYEF